MAPGLAERMACCMLDVCIFRRSSRNGGGVEKRWRRRLALADASATWRGWEELIEPLVGSLGSLVLVSYSRRARFGTVALWLFGQRDC